MLILVVCLCHRRFLCIKISVYMDELYQLHIITQFNKYTITYISLVLCRNHENLVQNIIGELIKYRLFKFTLLYGE